jgi:hypothetical protein
VKPDGTSRNLDNEYLGRFLHHCPNPTAAARQRQKYGVELILPSQSGLSRKPYLSAILEHAHV